VEADAAVRAMIVYGSLAQGAADEDSDLDVIIVAEPGQRDALWDRREQISDLIHGHHAVRHQEPLWQRPYRYQSWDEKLIELDLTLDEEHAMPWAALTRGFRAVVDKADVEARLRSDLATWQPREFDAPAFDGATWGWLNYLNGKLRRGEAWMVRYGVMDTLNNRVLPLLASRASPVRSPDPNPDQSSDHSSGRGRARTGATTGRHHLRIKIAQPEGTAAWINRRQRGSIVVRLRPRTPGSLPGRRGQIGEVVGLAQDSHPASRRRLRRALEDCGEEMNQRPLNNPGARHWDDLVESSISRRTRSHSPRTITSAELGWWMCSR
jgi:hypothetical protein